MGKQYNKVIKRRRRAAYLAKRKAALKQFAGKSVKTEKVKATKPKVAKKPVAKKEKVLEKTEPVAEKANPVDVLGPDDVPTVDESSSENKDDGASKDESNVSESS